MHRYARNAHDAYVPTSCHASRHATKHGYAVDHSNLLHRNAEIVNQADMLQQLCKLQAACKEPISACFVGKHGSMKLAGIIMHTHRGVVWADFDSVTCKMLSPRLISSTSTRALRCEIHRGGLVALPNDASVSVRKVG